MSDNIIPLESDDIPLDTNVRIEDQLYLIDWLRMHPYQQNLIQYNAIHKQIELLEGKGHEINSFIDEGTKFFQEFILDPGQIEDQTRENVVDGDSDPALTSFVTTRSVYLYVFGSKKDELPPSFFETRTRQEIVELRDKYKLEKNVQADLGPFMFDANLFKGKPKNRVVKRVFWDLKRAALSSQISLLTIKCWQKAANNDVQG